MVAGLLAVSTWQWTVRAASFLTLFGFFWFLFFQIAILKKADEVFFAFPNFGMIERYFQDSIESLKSKFSDNDSESGNEKDNENNNENDKDKDYEKGAKDDKIVILKRCVTQQLKADEPQLTV